MKHVFKTAAVSAVAAAIVASVAVAGAHQRQDQQNGQRATQGRRGGPGGPGAPGARGMGRSAGFAIPFQDLTDEQRQQVKGILDAAREGQHGPPAEMKLRQALEAELLADSPNERKIAELKQQLDAASAEQLQKHITTQRKINQVLTAEQRAKARERIASGPDNGPRGRRDGRGGGRGGGGSRL